MNIDSIKSPYYSAYLILKQSRRELIKLFPPKYEKVYAHHVTVRFHGVTEDDVPPDADIKVVGYADSGDGLETLVVTVNGTTEREEDGKTYHITWSLDPSKYSPVDSNDLIEKQGYEKLDQHVNVDHVKPSVIYK